MSTPILATKLYIPPSRPKIITRSHLIERLNEGLHHKLTLISAPVGYGKTTLVSDWLSTLNNRAAWLSLDQEDDEPRRFWAYVVAALQTIQPELGLTMLAMLQAPQLPPIENILSDLINQIASLSDKIILVLDDYHLLASSSLHQGTNFLLDHLPVQMHLVIITREDPPLPLPQLRAKGQMVELRIKDLRFTLAESDQFLNHKMGLNLPPEEITVLGQRTEGWVAGLQMAALSLHELDDAAVFIEAFAGDNRYVADYLISEVLDRQPEHIRDFLLKTAIVDRFTPALCNTLIGDESRQSGKIIEQIEALGLFVIPLDHVRQWYRYHQLFADLLRFRLRREDPSRFVELNRAASRWYEQHDLIEEAVKYALVSEDYQYVAELIEKSGLVMIGQSRLASLENWIVAIPEEIIQEHPYLSVLLAWVGSLTGQSDLVRQQLAFAEENLPTAKADLYSEIICQIALLRAYPERSRNNLDASIRHTLEAQDHLPRNNIFLDCTIHLNLGGNYWLKGDFSAAEGPLKRAVSFMGRTEVEHPALAAAGFLANAYLQQGQLRLAERLTKGVMKRYRRYAHPATAYVYLEQGELLYERNDLEGALEVLSKAIRIGVNADRIVNLVRAHQLLAQDYQALGEPEQALRLMAQADELFQQPSPRAQVMHQIEYDYYRLRFLLFQQDLRSAQKWAVEYETRRGAVTSPWSVLNELMYAQVLLGDGQPDRALPILKTCEEATRSYDADGWRLQSLLLQALCYQEIGGIENSLDWLHTPLDLAEPEDYIRTFVDYGAPMQRLLKFAAEHGVAPGYISRLLAAFPADEGEMSSVEPREAARQPLVEGLTDQERSILRFMAAGLSHREIASELFLSINTVKWHTTHIYSKLGVHRRAHAVERARELNIL